MLAIVTVFTFPSELLNSFVVVIASLATGSRLAWYSAKMISMSASLALWRVEIQLASATASWMAADKAPASPKGFNYPKYIKGQS